MKQAFLCWTCACLKQRGSLQSFSVNEVLRGMQGLQKSLDPSFPVTVKHSSGNWSTLWWGLTVLGHARPSISSSSSFSLVRQSPSVGGVWRARLLFVSLLAVGYVDFVHVGTFSTSSANSCTCIFIRTVTDQRVLITFRFSHRLFNIRKSTPIILFANN